MKKLFTTLALTLIAICVSAQTWDFTTTSVADSTAMAANAFWAYSSGRFSNAAATGEGIVISLSDYGLSAANGISVTTTTGTGFKAGNLRIDLNNRIQLNDSKASYILANRTVDDTVYVVFTTASSSNTSRSISADNGTVDNGTNANYSEPTTAKITVTAAGNLKLSQTGGLNVFKIYVVPKSATTGISTVKPATTQDSKCYSINGMKADANTKGIVIKNGKKYIQK